MHIDNERTLGAIKAEFNALFPFLKIEFFNKEHGSLEPSSAKDMIRDDSLVVGQISPSYKDGELKISPDMQVSELEQKFANVFGLNVQVFRQSGDLWLLTSNTDSWTLSKQNTIATEETKA